MALLVYADADGVERRVTVGAEPITVGRAAERAIRSTDPRVSLVGIGASPRFDSHALPPFRLTIEYG